MIEFNAAVEGYNRANAEPSPDALSRDELEEMMEEFPDGKNVSPRGRR